MGARGVEDDVGLDNSALVVANGNRKVTTTTPIPFKDYLTTVRDTAFLTVVYPLLLFLVLKNPDSEALATATVELSGVRIVQHPSDWFSPFGFNNNAIPYMTRGFNINAIPYMTRGFNLIAMKLHPWQ
ncbi:hypothetical protein L917_15860 [Phytophthora nicotianae]|uniref:Uncharacterized protein n=1 Tax=Phytophthora nicotianae TaxID=4792 RepID=W2KGC8_PHYNI|nr:hypothetical protein L917_15860 [Phytophthora nicotianae]